MHKKPILPPAIRQLWGLARPPAKGPKARLSLGDVADAGVRLADASELAGVTLAGVAKELGMTTTALYRYVDSKDTLVELMVDAALGEPGRVRQGPPREAFAHWATALRSRYAAHPWLATQAPTRSPRCPHSFAWLEQAVVLLTGIGVPDPLATAIAADIMIRGYAATEAAADEPAPELLEAVADRFPGLAGAPTSDPVEELETMLARLLRA